MSPMYASIVSPHPHTATTVLLVALLLSCLGRPAAAGPTAAGSDSSDEPTGAGAPWEWVTEGRSCESEMTLAEVEETLRNAPPMIVGFEHQAALGMLRSLALRVPCLEAPIPRRLLADLWYQMGMAALYTWDEQGQLQERGVDEVTGLFQKVRALVPSYVWDRRSFGSFGRDLWDAATTGKRLEPVKAVLPAGTRAGAIWVDGEALPGRTGEIAVSPGPCLVQTLAGDTLVGRWWIVPDSGPATIPVAEVGHEKAPASHTSVAVTAGAWSIPLPYAGPALHLHRTLGHHLEISAGSGAARSLSGDPTLWIVPIQAALWRPFRGKYIGCSLGLAYQGYVGRGFDPAPTDTSIETAWTYDPVTGWTPVSTTRIAHGATLVGLVHLTLGPWRIEARGAGGVLVWPGTLVAPQLHLALGFSRSLGSEVPR